MRAALYPNFKQPLTIENVSDPVPDADGIVLEVRATGLCRSDWHGWMGSDPDIKKLPHVPGHEMTGVVVAVGKDVTRWKGGERVTLPFVLACGKCEQCLSGNHQICDNQFQPGFTHWGSYAQYVAIPRADVNLVTLPEELDLITGASLGCRFATSFRAVVDVAKVSGGQWVAVHGCGGVGLSAIMIASALGANVIAVDITDEKLDFARSIGAAEVINAKEQDAIEAVTEITHGGAHVSIDALGSPVTSFNSISCLRKRGKHVQIGLMVEDKGQSKIPMSKVISKELEIYGSHGMQAHRYPALFEMIRSGKLHPEKLVGRTINLEQAAQELTHMESFGGMGVTVINEF
ncbi:MAG TPA: zinc-dependent alcohol dehydrogenase family protein [Anaerolineales bacterium]|jgi:alcohol dehydrogenase|nr:zinc-dependent alcohol dehydrogenase family protein [Anaerolineales bacterium]